MKNSSGTVVLGYQGINPTNPPQLIVETRNPGVNDRQGYKLLDLWVNYVSNQVFMLVSLARKTAQWALLFPSSGGGEIFATNSGNAIPNASNEIEVLGGTNFNTAGAGNTVTINLDNNLSIAGSLTIESLAAGVIQTDSNGEFFTSVGDDGYVLIGGGTEPQWAQITSGTITISYGPNTVDFTAPGVGDANFMTDDGTAVPIASTVIFNGISNMNTSASGNTVNINLDTTVNHSGNLTVTNDVIANQVIVGGDVGFSAFSEGVVQSNSSGVLTSSSGNDGEILIAATAGAPAWANITSTDASVTITNGANTINIENNSGGGLPQSSDGFLALNPSDFSNQSLDLLGQNVTMVEIFDDNNNFTPGNGAGTSAKYTAPSDGKYVMGFYMLGTGFPLTPGVTARQTCGVRINTTQHNWGQQNFTRFAPNTSGTVFRGAMLELFLDMGDTVEFQVINNTSGTPTVFGSPSVPLTYCFGYKVE